MTSISISSACISAHVSRMMSFNRPSTPFTRTGRRYFGHHTTWYLHEYTTFRLLLHLTKTIIQQEAI